MGGGHASAPAAPRSWWWRLWGTVLTLAVVDAVILLVGPLLWAGGKWSAGALKLSLVIMVGADLMLAVAMGWGLARSARPGTRPPRT